MSRASVQCHCRKCCALHGVSSDSKVEEVRLGNGHVARADVICKVAVTVCEQRVIVPDVLVGTLQRLSSVCECVCELVNEGESGTQSVLTRKTKPLMTSRVYACCYD